MAATRTPKKNKHYSPEEANATLPLLRLIVRDITVLARTLQEQHRQLERLQDRADVQVDEIADVLAEMEKAQEKMRGYEDELRELQVVIKDYLTGLIDFPARISGREVYLCWRLGEAEVAHWHELNAGFAGRQKLTKVSHC
jgi:hypothetical protein